MLESIQQIVAHVKAGKIDAQAINEEMVTQHLKIQSEPDLIIRTGGDNRTSNFMPWQSIYSEWFFVDKTWPELEKEDFINIIQEFSERERRFGK